LVDIGSVERSQAIDAATEFTRGYTVLTDSFPPKTRFNCSRWGINNYLLVGEDWWGSRISGLWFQGRNDGIKLCRSDLIKLQELISKYLESTKEEYDKRVAEWDEQDRLQKEDEDNERGIRRENDMW
jgi:hypothetical protein